MMVAGDGSNELNFSILDYFQNITINKRVKGFKYWSTWCHSSREVNRQTVCIPYLLLFHYGCARFWRRKSLRMYLQGLYYCWQLDRNFQVFLQKPINCLEEYSGVMGIFLDKCGVILHFGFTYQLVNYTTLIHVVQSVTFKMGTSPFTLQSSSKSFFHSNFIIIPWRIGVNGDGLNLGRWQLVQSMRQDCMVFGNDGSQTQALFLHYSQRR